MNLTWTDNIAQTLFGPIVLGETELGVIYLLSAPWSQQHYLKQNWSGWGKARTSAEHTFLFRCLDGLGLTLSPGGPHWNTPLTADTVFGPIELAEELSFTKTHTSEITGHHRYRLTKTPWHEPLNMRIFGGDIDRIHAQVAQIFRQMCHTAIGQLGGVLDPLLPRT